MTLGKIAISFLLLFFVNASFSQKNGLEAIDISDLKTHLTYLASDELQGRSFGTPVDGLSMAADYLAANAKQLGLKPGGPGYFQSFDVLAVKSDPENYVEINDAQRHLLYHSDQLLELSGPIETSVQHNLPVILAGFGENLKGIKAEGKVIVVAQGNHEDYRNNAFRWNNRLEAAKIDSLTVLNPKAILIVTHPNDKKKKVFKQIGVWLSRERYTLTGNESPEIPVLIVQPELADKLFEEPDGYKKYLGKVERKKAGNKEIGNSTLSFRTGKLSRHIETKNVIGVVEGSDSVLKNECVVFMAHYDHLGIADDGNVYNGADDNGSGTVSIMEVAEAFASLSEKPKRSIVFLWVSGEELGMLGSGYYAGHPLFPMDKTAVCFNLDMVGRVFEERDTVWNRSPKRVKDFDGLFTLSNNVWPELSDLNQKICSELQLVPDTTLPASFLRSSDHYSFHKNGVPIMNYATGYHADYHKVGDEVSKISFEKMKRVTELCFLMGLEVANRQTIERILPQQ